MAKITVGELLDELDGDGIVWTDSDLTSEALKKLGLSHETEIKTIEVKDLGISQRSDSWFKVWDLCIKLGMDTDNGSGEECVLKFIKSCKSK